MKTCEELKEQMKTVLSNMDIKFQYFEIDGDEDISYLVEFQPTESLKSIKTVRVLLYLEKEINCITLLAPNVYETDSEQYEKVQNIVKKSNELVMSGKFHGFISENDSARIYYTCKVSGGDDFSNLNKEIIQSQFDNYEQDMSLFYHILEEEIDDTK